MSTQTEAAWIEETMRLAEELAATAERDQPSSSFYLRPTQTRRLALRAHLATRPAAPVNTVLTEEQIDDLADAHIVWGADADIEASLRVFARAIERAMITALTPTPTNTGA